MQAGTATILTYHHIGEIDSPFIRNLGSEISVKQFERQIEFFKKNYKVEPFSKIKNETGEGVNRISITFDDGYQSIYHTVLPVIERYEIPIKIFLNKAAIESGYLWLNKLSYIVSKLSMSALQKLLQKEMGCTLPENCSREELSFHFWYSFQWPKSPQLVEEYYAALTTEPIPRFFLDYQQVLELARHPLIEIGTHSRNHYPLHKLPFAVLHDEVVAHHLELKKSIPGVKGFAIPFGFKEHVTEDVERCIREIDDELLFSRGGKKISSHPWGLKARMRFPADALSFLS